MAPTQPSPADFVTTAEVIEMYIRLGKEAALSLCPPWEGAIEAPFIPPVIEPLPDPIASPPAPPEPVPLATVVQLPAEPRDAEVIPLTARTAANPQQEGARRMIEKTRKARVDSIMNEASVAKVRAHKQRLADDADDAGLNEYPVVVDDETMTLGAYLASLLGS